MKDIFIPFTLFMLAATPQSSISPEERSITSYVAAHQDALPRLPAAGGWGRHGHTASQRGCRVQELRRCVPVTTVPAAGCVPIREAS